jgi:hypothetical protein
VGQILDKGYSIHFLLSPEALAQLIQATSLPVEFQAEFPDLSSQKEFKKKIALMNQHLASSLTLFQ